MEHCGARRRGSAEVDRRAVFSLWRHGRGRQGVLMRVAVVVSQNRRLHLYLLADTALKRDGDGLSSIVLEAGGVPVYSAGARASRARVDSHLVQQRAGFGSECAKVLGAKGCKVFRADMVTEVFLGFLVFG